MSTELPDIFIRAILKENISEIERLLWFYHKNEAIWEKTKDENKDNSLCPLVYAIKAKKFKAATYFLTHPYPNSIPISEVVDVFCDQRSFKKEAKKRSLCLFVKTLLNIIKPLPEKHEYLQKISYELISYSEYFNLISWAKKNKLNLYSYKEDGSSNTLIEAICNRHLKTALKLIENNINVNWKSHMGATAAHYAFRVFNFSEYLSEENQNNYLKLMDALINAGADLSLKTFDNQSVEQFQIKSSKGEVKHWIEAYWLKERLNQNLKTTTRQNARLIRL